jgi:molecular chaperone GrpE
MSKRAKASDDRFDDVAAALEAEFEAAYKAKRRGKEGDAPEEGGAAAEEHPAEPQADAPLESAGDAGEGAAPGAGKPSPATAQRVTQLEQELEQSLAARMRVQADFANFQRRARENETRAMGEGTARVLRSLVPVLDHLDLALGPGAAATTIDQLRDGVQIVRAELMKVLEGFELKPINPSPGDEFDAKRHQAVMQRATSAQAPGTISEVLQVGYSVGDVTLRPAAVVVATAE